MNEPLTSLNVIDVAAPCPADWDAMTGDDRVRHCSQCNLDVYNFSEMTEKEALALVNERQGRLCAQFYRRADGTVITRDCPVGVRALRQKLVRMWAKAVALTGAFVVHALFGRTAQAQDVQPVAPVIDPAVIELVKGDVCIVRPTPGPQLTYDGLKMLPAKTIKEYLAKCLAKEEQAAYGMPDPDNKAVLAEAVRQDLQRKVNDPKFLPEAGSKAHDDLANLTAELLKKHTAVAAEIMGPVREFPRPDLGRLMVRPVAPIEVMVPK